MMMMMVMMMCLFGLLNREDGRITKVVRAFFTFGYSQFGQEKFQKTKRKEKIGLSNETKKLINLYQRLNSVRVFQSDDHPRSLTII
jgi:hypothetical protein